MKKLRITVGQNTYEVTVEVLSDVSFEVWRRAASFEGRSKLRTWVLGIANYKVLDRLRRDQKRIFEEPDESLPDPQARDPLESVASAETAEGVEHCMEGLSDPQRQVVHLAFFEDLSYSEISEIANCPEGTVKTRMYHAKRALKRCLERLFGRRAD